MEKIVEQRPTQQPIPWSEQSLLQRLQKACGIFGLLLPPEARPKNNDFGPAELLASVVISFLAIENATSLEPFQSLLWITGTITLVSLILAYRLPLLRWCVTPVYYLGAGITLALLVSYVRTEHWPKTSAEIQRELDSATLADVENRLQELETGVPRDSILLRLGGYDIDPDVSTQELLIIIESIAEGKYWVTELRATRRAGTQEEYTAAIDEALSQSAANGFERSVLLALKASELFRIGEFRNAADTYMKAAAVYPENYRRSETDEKLTLPGLYLYASIAFSRQGMVSGDRAAHEQSIELLKRVSDLYEKSGNQQGVETMHGALGFAYRDLYLLTDDESFLDAALSAFSRVADRQTNPNSLMILIYEISLTDTQNRKEGNLNGDPRRMLNELLAIKQKEIYEQYDFSSRLALDAWIAREYHVVGEPEVSAQHALRTVEAVAGSTVGLSPEHFLISTSLAATALIDVLNRRPLDPWVHNAKLLADLVIENAPDSLDNEPLALQQRYPLVIAKLLLDLGQRTGEAKYDTHAFLLLDDLRARFGTNHPSAGSVAHSLITALHFRGARSSIDEIKRDLVASIKLADEYRPYMSESEWRESQFLISVSQHYIGLNNNEVHQLRAAVDTLAALDLDRVDEAEWYSIRQARARYAIYQWDLGTVLGDSRLVSRGLALGKEVAPDVCNVEPPPFCEDPIACKTSPLPECADLQEVMGIDVTIKPEA